MFPIHCNQCFKYRENHRTLKFHLTECKHILCAGCVENVPKDGENSEKCPLCNVRLQTININRNMPNYFTKYFEDPLKLLNVYKEVSKFQSDQIKSHLIHGEELESRLPTIQRELEAYKKMEDMLQRENQKANQKIDALKKRIELHEYNDGAMLQLDKKGAMTSSNAVRPQTPVSSANVKDPNKRRSPAPSQKTMDPYRPRTPTPPADSKRPRTPAPPATKGRNPSRPRTPAPSQKTMDPYRPRTPIPPADIKRPRTPAPPATKGRNPSRPRTPASKMMDENRKRIPTPHANQTDHYRPRPPTLTANIMDPFKLPAPGNVMDAYNSPSSSHHSTLRSTPSLNTSVTDSFRFALDLSHSTSSTKSDMKRATGTNCGQKAKRNCNL